VDFADLVLCSVKQGKYGLKESSIFADIGLDFEIKRPAICGHVRVGVIPLNCRELAGPNRVWPWD
jgi:hypothetical protein